MSHWRYRASMTPHGVTSRLRPFGTTIFAEMSRLAAEHNAINLSQGFPDFDGPQFLKDAALAAMRDGHNQYAPSNGVPALTTALAERWQRITGQAIDPGAQVTVTSGCTEAIAATLLGLLEPGDEVILIEPFYDSYRACVAMAGGVARFVALRPPPPGSAPEEPFWLDEAELRAAFTDRTRAILINTPHNPTGKVFTGAELQAIARLCIEHDVVAITDEVYEDLVFDGPHIRMATLPRMAERTITLSSLGKTFSMTGWKIGWAIAPPELSRAVRAAHQFLTYAVATPFQHAAAAAIRDGAESIAALVDHYLAARDLLCGALADLGFGVHRPAGTYFIMADHSAFGFPDDAAFCRHLTADIGVAAIPPSSFYQRPELGRALVRFAFCKKMETLHAAIARLGALRRP